MRLAKIQAAAQLPGVRGYLAEEGPCDWNDDSWNDRSWLQGSWYEDGWDGHWWQDDIWYGDGWPDDSSHGMKMAGVTTV